jgi:hypothetical protein
MKSTTKPLNHTREFWCETCGKDLPGQPMRGQQIMAHLEATHGLGKPFTGSKKGLAFIDGEGFYTNTFEWNLPGGVKVTEVANGPKGG